MSKSHYTIDMDNWSKFLDEPKNDAWSGTEIHNLIEGVHEDYKTAVKSKRKVNPTKVLYYRDLLSYLVKTYGH